MSEERMELLYHSISPEVAKEMAQVRSAYYSLYEIIDEAVPASRSKSLAITHLEDSLMRAMQAFALEYGTPQPLGT